MRSFEFFCDFAPPLGSPHPFIDLFPTGRIMKKKSAILLPEILSMTEKMGEDARADDWEKVRELEQERQKLIDSCFPLDESIEDPRLAGEQIKSVLELDKQLMALAKTQQQMLSNTLAKLSQGRQATKAYQEVGK